MPSGKTREEIAQAYASPPWWYDIRGFFILTFAYNGTLGQQLRFFGRNFGPKHVEVACGSGTLLQLLLRWRKRRNLPDVDVVAIDYAESMLAGAIRRFRNDPRVEPRHADAADMPFPDNTFDTANIANSVHSFPDPDGALREIFRILKPGGTLAANVLLHPRGMLPLRLLAERINRWGTRKGILVTPYSVDNVRKKFLSAGFEVKQESVSGNCLNILVAKPK